MGQGGRGNSTYSLTYTVSPVVRRNSVGKFVTSRRSMASGHSRSSSNDSSSASSSSGCFEHPVSRFDTLAGVAIKYGVEVGDIKRLNGLVTDLQMFALKTLKIPLRGRHLPTPSTNNAGFSGKPPRADRQPNPYLAQILKDSGGTKEPDKRPVTSAMGLLRGYYGLSTATAPKLGPEGTEMAVYKSDSGYHSEDEPFSPFQPFSPEETGRSRHQNNVGSSDSAGQFLNDYQPELHPGAGKARATAPFDTFPKPSRSTVLKLEPAGDSGGISEIDRANERLFRRRSKGEIAAGLVPDLPPEMTTSQLLEISDRMSAVPLGKSSALRQKIPPPLDDSDSSVSRPVVNSSLNGWHTNSDSGSGLAGSAVRALSTSILSGRTVEGLISKIRRSASNPSLHDERRSYKSDSSGTLMVSQGSLQTGVISSVLEGFPKAASGAIRRNKAALD